MNSKIKRIINCLLLSIIVVFISSCLKSGGSIKIINNSDNPYSITLNGTSKGTINGHETKNLVSITAGTYTITVTQLSGYLIYPSVYSTSLTLENGKTYNWSFP